MLDKKAREDKDKDFEKKVFMNMDKEEQVKMSLDQLFLNEAKFQMTQPVNVDHILMEDAKAKKEKEKKQEKEAKEQK
jgi:hypothetical protein